jgi:dTDP-4-dehydrorhamnose reductase
MIKADITDSAAVAALFAAVKPDFVIHAAAERRPDIVDKTPSVARTLNVAATETIARACADHGAFMLYISTDYVFDGSNPPYFPDSPVNPLNEYGRLKLEGERRVAALLGVGLRAAILRIPLLYGPVERLDECSVTELATLLKRREPCAVEHWARRYPLHVDDVAEGIGKILEASASRPDGPAAALPRTGLSVYLLSGPVAYTKYEMLMTMAKILGIDASFAQPDAAPPKGAPRPKDCRMDTSLIEALGYRPRVAFESGIGGTLAPFFRD